MDGPLKGYHHQTFAVRLDPGSPLARDFTWLKLREPRAGVFWYDMRWFASEDVLLRVLHAHRGPYLPHIPTVGEHVVRDQRVTFLAFIEGISLDRAPGGGRGPVAERFVRQIEDLFRSLAALDPEPLARYGSPPACDCPGADPAGYPARGGSTAFLRRLTHFTVVHAYREQHADLAGLLQDLQVPRDALTAFAARTPDLTDRPRALLHGDLHRKNFIVDRAGTLWTIDWELAQIGDPLYDLATHLHLMDYPLDQERDVIVRWQRAVGPAASAGARADLPHYRAYKRVQSLCTDVIRSATRLAQAGARPGTRAHDVLLRGAAAIAHRVLEAAREPLGMEKTVPRVAVEAVFEAWSRRAGGVTAGGGPSTCPGR